MKISVFTHMKDPEKRMDPWKEALDCYSSISKDLVIVGDDLEEEFNWNDLGAMFQKGFNKSMGDWVINLSVDMILHEKDIPKLIKLLKMYPDEPAFTLPKYKFFEGNRYEIKNFETLIFNKNKYKNILFNGGGDNCLPTLNGKVLDQTNIRYFDIPIWNYDTTFRTKEIIARDRARFARAWHREFKDYGERGGPSEEEAFEAWFNMVKDRYPLHTNLVKLDDHPKFIVDKLKSLKKDQFGFDLFGLKGNTKFPMINKFEQKKIKIKYKI